MLPKTLPVSRFSFEKGRIIGVFPVTIVNKEPLLETGFTSGDLNGIQLITSGFLGILCNSLSAMRSAP